MEKGQRPHQEDVPVKQFKTTGFPITRERNSYAHQSHSPEEETLKKRTFREYQRDSLGTFLREIDKFPLLDSNGVQAKILIDTLRNYKIPDEKTKTEEQIKKEKLEAVRNNPEFWKAVKPENRHQKPEQFENAFERSRSIEEFIIHCNLRLLVKAASQMKILSTEDKIQVGFAGLNKAIKYFDPEKGRFSTLATRLIQQEIYRSTVREHRMIRMPESFEKALSQTKKAVAEFTSIHAREPDMAELEVFLKEKDELPFNLIQTGIQIYSSEVTNIASLDIPLSSDRDESASLQDVLRFQADKTSSEDQTISIIHDAQVRKTLSEALSKLSSTEIQVIKLSFGFSSPKKKSRSEIEEALGLSTNQINYIRKKALEKLKNNPELAGMLTADEADNDSDENIQNKTEKPRHSLPEVDYMPPGVRPETHAFIQDARKTGILQSLDKEAKVLLYKYFGTDTSLLMIGDEKKFGSKVTVGKKIKKILQEIWDELPETITEKYIKEEVIQLKDLKGRKVSEERKNKISKARKKMFEDHPELKTRISEMRKNDPRVAEQIKKFAEMHRGVPRTEAEKAKMSASHLGHDVSPETRAKLSEMRKGVRKTPEHKQAISEGLKQFYSTKKNEQEMKTTPTTIFEPKSKKK